MYLVDEMVSEITDAEASRSRWPLWQRTQTDERVLAKRRRRYREMLFYGQLRWGWCFFLLLFVFLLQVLPLSAKPRSLLVGLTTTVWGQCVIESWHRQEQPCKTHKCACRICLPCLFSKEPVSLRLSQMQHAGSFRIILLLLIFVDSIVKAYFASFNADFVLTFFFCRSRLNRLTFVLMVQTSKPSTNHTNKHTVFGGFVAQAKRKAAPRQKRAPRAAARRAAGAAPGAAVGLPAAAAHVFAAELPRAAGGEPRGRAPGAGAPQQAAGGGAGEGRWGWGWVGGWVGGGAWGLVGGGGWGCGSGW